MWKGIVLQIVAVVLAFAASVVSFNLLTKHLTGQSGSAWFDAGCPVNPEPGGANCGAVLASRYGYWPPRDPQGNPIPGRRHIPVAFFGVAYYLALAAWLIGVGRPTRSRRWFHLVPLLFSLFGLMGSGYFLTVMFSELDHWCSWCVVTHVMNLLIAVCLLLMWPRSVQAASSPGTEPSSVPSPASASPPPAPTWRLAFFTALLVLMVTGFGLKLLVIGMDALIEHANARAEANSYKDMIQRIKSDPDKLLKLWDAEPTREIALRPDDPIRAQVQLEDDLYLDVVAFSDLECPSCKTFAIFLETQVQPLFAKRLRLAFKHFPLDSTCNPHVSMVVHPNACTAARIIEAARLQGGPLAFWKAHDFLFNLQKLPPAGLNGIDPGEFAKTIGLNPDQLVADMANPAVEQRMREDLEQAKKLGIKSTPMVFAHGKLVESIAYKEIGFWNALADAYWQSIGAERPESTKLPPPAPTPNTPGPKGAP